MKPTPAFDRAAALVQEGHAALARGEFPAAEGWFRAAMQASPRAPEPYHGVALVAFGVGQLEVAESFARQAIKRAPKAARLFGTLGRIRKALGQLDDAESAYRRALRLDPTLAETHVSLGVAVRAQGKPKDAIIHYQRALGIKPALFEAYVNLENAASASGARATHCDWLHRFIADHPDCAEAQFFLGKSLFELGEREEALDCFRAAAELQPEFYEAQAMLGEALASGTRFRAAVVCFRRAAEIRSSDPEAQYNLGIALRNDGDGPGAIAALQRAVTLRPDYADAHRSLTLGLMDLGQYAEAVRHGREVARLEPDKALAHMTEGLAFHSAGLVTEAIDAFRRGLERDPRHFETHTNLGNALLLERRYAEAVESYRAAAAVRPNQPLPQQNLVFALNYVAGLSAEEVIREHREFGARVAEIVPRLPPATPEPYDRARPLRVALLSPDFKNHSVSYFIEPFIARHDRARIQLTCYSNVRFEDAVSQRLRGYGVDWVNVFTLSDVELTRRIRDDRIDILIDLAGHTSGNRAGVLALKPAPVQMIYLGYPTITGLQTVDYRITDGAVDPPGAEAPDTERPLRLPGSYFCYRPGAEPPIADPPCAREGAVTFGSFNNLPKVSASTVRLWSRVLHALPESQLFVKTRALNDAAVRAKILDDFGIEGIPAERLRLSGWSATGTEHFAAYNSVDVALDCHPYNGATTTCEALWMGVPVVSLAGRTHASRMGLSILTAAGLAELAVADEEGFVARCAALAGDRERLRELRSGMRERLRASPLMDEAAHTRALEDALDAAMRAHAPG